MHDYIPTPIVLRVYFNVTVNSDHRSHRINVKFQPKRHLSCKLYRMNLLNQTQSSITNGILVSTQIRCIYCPHKLHSPPRN